MTAGLPYLRDQRRTRQDEQTFLQTTGSDPVAEQRRAHAAALSVSAHHPKSDDRKVMIERVGEPYPRTLHDSEASGIDGGQFVQVATPEIFPRSLQIAQTTGKDVESARPGYQVFPRQRHIPVGVAIEKGECLNDNRNGGVQPGAGRTQQIPLFPRLRMQRVSRQRQGDPRPAVDEDRLPCRITARRKRYRARSSCVSARRPKSQLDRRLAASE